ncbi:hypothetical protein FAF44_18735 [Nonomuraea sp. MG754425]|uniref:hypothetical protein n=1 Tax=Nonomuraea sp. MG754425 TaxID=2570319 RepID=UPI001F29BE1C|nr:hypothetical protein [Nonomuraea sp. MG754425]MCF6470419.1 hypothetical protein [Nonomuraea sp. MG754425]
MRADIDHIVARFADEPAPGVSDGARELMREIMAGPPPLRPARRRRLSWKLTVPAVGVLVAGVLAMSWVLPSGLGGPAPVAALDIRQEDGYYVIQIKDLYADPGNYEAQLRAVGLDVSLRVLPASPAFEGQVFSTRPDHQVDERIKGIDAPGACDKLGGCMIGVKIPVGFTDKVQIDVGRPARPGERYRSGGAFDAKGEPMHCVPYLNKSLAEVRQMLTERGLAIGEVFVAGVPGTETADLSPGDVRDSWLVHGGYLTEPGRASLFANPAPMSPEAVAKSTRECPTS